ncbi:MAG TPA: glycosyltransferase family 4 protein [Candidatus Limnocylindrales bacterium]|nr:glycosyltransferase family 4 protein [Candidatus Limnocylindrales bacterium]
MSRVLLLTSHPIAPPRDSADKEIAYGVAQALSAEHRFVYFGRAGAPRLAGMPGRRIPVLSWTGRPGLAERAQVALAGIVVEQTVDMVHAVLTIGPQFAGYAAARRRLPDRFRRPVLHTVPAIVDASGLDGRDALGPTVAMSESSAASLRNAGFPVVGCVPPAVDLERWLAVPRPTGPAIVMFAGHHGANDGGPDAIRGFRAAALDSGALVLAMRPRGGEDERVEQAALARIGAEAGLRELTVLGVVDDMPALVAKSSLVLMVPRALRGKADVPIIVLEAMATGRPVVVSDLPSFELLGDGVRRVPAGDAAALGRVVGELLGDRDAYDRQVAAGRLALADRFSPLAMAAAYRRLYGEVIRAS